MIKIHWETDAGVCEKLWRQFIVSEKVADLWETRECFHRYFQREFRFIVAEQDGHVVGLMPLSWVPEKNCLAYFPGETWKGTTWLEQNRIFARGKEVFAAMFDWLKQQNLSYHLRYLNDHSSLEWPAVVDETGYLFISQNHNHSFENYREAFSRKSIKALDKLVQEFNDRGAAFRFDQFDDVELMIDLNIERFGESSYFSDSRFVSGFRDLRKFLQEQGWLKMTTVLIEGKPAAVDFGIVYKNAYTLLAGGTNGAFPGIAKFINLHHIEEACKAGYSETDFLCGEFFWKPMFHLTPRPLYLLSNMPMEEKH